MRCRLTRPPSPPRPEVRGSSRWFFLPVIALVGVVSCTDQRDPMAPEDPSAPAALPATVSEASVYAAPAGSHEIVTALDHRLCMRVENRSREPGARVVLGPCSQDGEHLQWYLPAPGTTGEVRIYGTMCLDDGGGQGLDGDQLIIWPCWGGPPQQWEVTESGELRGINDKCVDVAGFRAESGTPIILWSCHGGENQRWTLRRFPQPLVLWVNRLTGQCLDVWDASREAGAKLVIWPCHGGENQRFSQAPIETVQRYDEMRVYGTLCVDDGGGLMQDGDPIIAWNCWGGPPQRWQWTARSELRLANGKCLEVPGGRTEPGTEVILWTCNGGDNQKWDRVRP